MKITIKGKRNIFRRTDRGVPFEEMCRLMEVYGSVKCLRKRLTPAGDENAKIDSVKRKFYRWFPNLDDRFDKDKNGHYQPKLGHEFETSYRKKMRSEDGEVLAKKRAACRKERHGGVKKKTKCTKVKASSTPSSCLPSAISPPKKNSNVVFTGIKVTPKCVHDPMKSSSAAITAGSEPVDSCFIAQKGIFDDVEMNFYGPAAEDEFQKFVENSLIGSSSSNQECPSLQHSLISSSSSSNSEEQEDPSVSFHDSDSQSIEDVLEKTIDECCQDVLGLADSGSIDSCRFALFSTGELS